MKVHSPLLTQQSLHAIAPLTGLKKLDFPIKEIDREAFAVAAGLKSLETLILREAKMVDTQFKVLKGHPSLKSLFLESSTLTEESAEILESLPALEYGEFGKKSWIKKIDRPRTTPAPKRPGQP